VPYRIQLGKLDRTAAERLIDLGALDIDTADDGSVTALMPDGITPDDIARVVGARPLSVSPAVVRDGGSVWVLRPPAIRIGRLTIAAPDDDTGAGALRLADSPIFGSGLHPTTALCLEILDELTQTVAPDRVLDVGTGSGVLALAALQLGVAHATAIDIDDAALAVAAENAQINGLSARVQFARGGPEVLTGSWPVVLANVSAAVLVEMAPVLARRVGHHGHLVLSGIPTSAEPDVDRAYHRLGMHRVATRSRGGWVALERRASW
jgi:ribosomal protein L11 methyltransferase